jgi:hypothetical protein
MLFWCLKTCTPPCEMVFAKHIIDRVADVSLAAVESADLMTKIIDSGGCQADELELQGCCRPDRIKLRLERGVRSEEGTQSKGN